LATGKPAADKVLAGKACRKISFPAPSGDLMIYIGAALTNASLIPKIYCQARLQQAVCVHRICAILLLQ
jgi:hypothetical protein